MNSYRRLADTFARSAGGPGTGVSEERAQRAQRLAGVTYEELLRDRLAYGTPDQVADRRSGRFAPFFGQPAYTGTLSCKLVKQTNARVFMAWARRLPGDEGFEIRVRPADPDIHDEDLDHALRAMNRSIEALILEDPSQYLWSYKRFRRQPPGGTLPY